MQEIVAPMQEVAGINDVHVQHLGGKTLHNADSGITLSHCSICVLASNYPGVSFDEEGVCNFCQNFQSAKHLAESDFRTPNELKERLLNRAQQKKGQYDCLLLLSGGKDSTYTLFQLADMGLNILSMTLDNGYISEGAKQNISRSVNQLGVEHRFLTTQHMAEIFADSLSRHSSVCYGCFKTIYTMAVDLADLEGIPSIVTGLSRGQLFETRLTKQLLELSKDNPNLIDQEVLQSRKIYHGIQDRVTECFPDASVNKDHIFEKIEFIDFYRYYDVPMQEMYHYLDQNAPWVRPSDTGRSTNCLINDTGIHVHIQKNGYHNYALPYSWDVRLGHKTRKESMAELNDHIDTGKVHQILEEIGFDQDIYSETKEALAVFYTSDRDIENQELREVLSRSLPPAAIPSYFIRLDQLPLNINGKVDKDRLPDPRHKSRSDSTPMVAPSTALESELLGVWKRFLNVTELGVTDNFFSLGGDSISAIQIVADQVIAGYGLTANDVFTFPTIKQLAEKIDASEPVVAVKTSKTVKAFSLLDDALEEDMLDFLSED